jgi:hypothetical protein
LVTHPALATPAPNESAAASVAHINAFVFMSSSPPIEENLFSPSWRRL